MSLLRSDAGARRDVQPMRRLIPVVAALAVIAAATPVHAARTGAIEGRVVNGTTGGPQRGVEVTLTSGSADDSSKQRVLTGPDGRYRFDGLPTGEDLYYVVDATYKEGLFAGRPVTLPSDTERSPVIESTLRVFEPTTDPSAILIRRDDLFVVHKDDRLSVVEAIKVINPTRNAYIGRGSDLAPSSGDEPTASLGFSLPDTALPETFRWVDADLDVPQAVDLQGVGFGITTAIPPGELDFTFSYQVAGDGGTFDLSRRALYEVSELSVFAAEPLTVESNRLEPGDEVTLEGTTYRRFTTPAGADPADPLQILIVADAGAPATLVGGLATGLVVLGALGAVALNRGRRRRTASPPEPAPDRAVLVAAIAELDLRHTTGDVPDDEYARRRAELKEQLAGMTAGEGSR